MDVPQPSPAPYTSPISSAPVAVVPPSSGSNTGKIIGVLIAVVIVAAAAYYFFGRTSGDVATDIAPTVSTSPMPTLSAGPQQFSWDDLSFTVPAGWQATVTTYASPAQLAQGQSPDEVGFQVSKSGLGTITAGGPQSSGRVCTDETGATRCAIIQLSSGSTTMYTTSAQTETLAAFDAINKSITYTSTPTPNPTAGWNTYTSTLYGYQFSYPDGFTIISPPTTNTSNYPPECQGDGGITGVCAQMTGQYMQAHYAGTNLIGATFAVKILNKAPNPQATESACATLQYGTPYAHAMTEKATVNGVVYFTGTVGGVAAGTSYGGKVYRTFHNNQCWDLYLGQGSTGCGPDFGGARCLSASENTALTDFQNAMLNSFKFTK